MFNNLPGPLSAVLFLAFVVGVVLVAVYGVAIFAWLAPFLIGALMMFFGFAMLMSGTWVGVIGLLLVIGGGLIIKDKIGDPSRPWQS